MGVWQGYFSDIHRKIWGQECRVRIREILKRKEFRVSLFALFETVSFTENKVFFYDLFRSYFPKLFLRIVLKIILFFCFLKIILVI